MSFDNVFTKKENYNRLELFYKEGKYIYIYIYIYIEREREREATIKNKKIILGEQHLMRVLELVLYLL